VADALVEHSSQQQDEQSYPEGVVTFSDTPSAMRWFQGITQPYVYTLFNDQSRLVGVVCYERLSHPDHIRSQFRVSARMYPPAQGRGLAHDFVSRTLDDHGMSHPDCQIWTEFGWDNDAAHALVRKLGFKRSSHSTQQVVFTRTSQAHHFIA